MSGGRRDRPWLSVICVNFANLVGAPATMWVMRYIVSGRWSRAGRFVITGESGAPRFDVHGSIGLSRLTLRDQSGQDLAEINKHHLMSSRRDIVMNGRAVAEVRHEGLFGARYRIDSSAGQFTAKGNVTGWEYTISDGGRPVATVTRERALREKFLIDIGDDADHVLVLALALAISAIQHQRR